jgi:hypothetical protein
MHTTSPPHVVLRARTLWIVAVAAGILETGLAIAQGYTPSAITTGELLANLAVRGIVFGIAIFLAQSMGNGSNGARWGLTVRLGVIGLGSLLIGPAEWLLAGNTVADLNLSALEWVFASSRVVHVCAVVAAVVLMFQPSANRWFGQRTAMIGATS